MFPVERRDDGADCAGAWLARAIPPAGQAVMLHSRNPLAAPVEHRAVAPLTPLCDLAPVTAAPLMLRLNGQWLLRKDWHRPALPGDVIEWHEVPQGRTASRVVLTIIVIYLSIQFGPQVGAAMGLAGKTAAAVGSIAINLAGTAIINALVPIKQPDAGAAAANPQGVYSVATSANIARLGQPVPVIYGRHLVYPDYAAQPYAEFGTTQYFIGGTVASISYDANEQFFHAVYCIGQGRYTVERVTIDDTDINHFQDVQYRVLPPGVAPSLVATNVITAPEVSGQALHGLESDGAPIQYIGAFAACGPGWQATHIGVDVLFDRLGYANDDGSAGPASAVLRFEARPIDDFGAATGAWFVLGTQTISRASLGPVRVSLKWALPTSARVEVRAARIDRQPTDNRTFSDAVWGGLRAYLDTPAPLVQTATHLEVRIRASEQLSGLSQRKIGVIVRRHLRTWAPGTGWGPEVETRSTAWALADLWSNPTYGDGLPDARIDLQTLYDLDRVWSARQDRFDMVFDSATTSWEAASIIAQSGRAVPFRRMGVNTLMRDGLQTLPVTAYTSRNMLPGASIGYALATESTPDAVVVEYFDYRRWDWRDVTCRAPGIVTPLNPVRLRRPGITGPKHAEREGLYLAAQHVYRRRFPKWQTEMAGLLPSYGALVACAPALAALVTSGDAVAYDAATRVLTVSEPLAFDPGTDHTIRLQRDDGSVTAPIAAAPGPDEYTATLASAPDFELICDDPSRERPKFIFGTVGDHRTHTRVLGIRKRGRTGDGGVVVEMSGVVDDERVHTADVHLLPAPGEVQDAVTLRGDVTEPNPGLGTAPGSGSGDGYDVVVLVSLSDHHLLDRSSVGGFASFTLEPNGRARTATSYGTQTHAGQWLDIAPVEPHVAARFEARATLLESMRYPASAYEAEYGAPPNGAALDAWLPLGSVAREWSVTTASGDQWSVSLSVEIREIATGVVQTARRIDLISDSRLQQFE